MIGNHVYEFSHRLTQEFVIGKLQQTDPLIEGCLTKISYSRGSNLNGLKLKDF